MMTTIRETERCKAELARCLKWVEEMPVGNKAQLRSINKVASKIRKRIQALDDEIVEIKKVEAGLPIIS